MALPKPNQLRYAECDIPLDVEQAIQAFVDEFYVDMSAIDKELDDINASDVPAILAAEATLTAALQQMLQGAPIEQLSSLQALQDNLYLANPQLSETDPSVVSLDERKLGAVGMALVNGKMFAMASGSDFETFRQLWLAAGGDYQAFLALGDGIEGAADGDFTLLQYVPGANRFPFVNKTWSVLDKFQANVRLSKYVQPLIWTNQLGKGSATYNRLKAIGYSDLNVSRILAGKQPRDGGDTITALLQASVAQVTFLSSLYALPASSPQRDPKWANEVRFLKGALTNYLKFRQEMNLSSLVFNSDLWERMKASLAPADMKEIFEKRPEIKNMIVPTDANTIGNLLNAASSLQPGSTAINSYMVKLPKTFSAAAYEARLLSVGASLLQSLVEDVNPASGAVQALLAELKGGAVGSGDVTTPPPLSVSDMQSALGSPAQTQGSLASTVNSGVTSSPDPKKTLDSLAAVVAGQGTITALGSVVAPVSGNVPASPSSTTTLGLPTAENYMTNLFRRIKWDQNFVTCSKVTGASTNTGTTNLPLSQQTNTYPSASTVENKFTKFGPALNKNISNAPITSASSPSAQARNTVVANQGANPSQVKSQFSYACSPSLNNGFLNELADLTGKVSNEIIIICEALKRALLLIQNIIDSLIAKAQVILDQVLGTLERLLTLNINLGANLGFDNSLLKCSWGINLVGKIDFFGLLLKALNDFFNSSPIILGIRKALKAIRDLITQAICVPVRLLEAFLGGANALLGIIGCSLKDIQLPQPILDLLKALLFTFDLRQLVLQKGYDAFYSLAANLTKGSQSFNGLSQFAQLCQSVTMADAIGTIEQTSLLAGLAAPAKLANQLSKAANTQAQNVALGSVGGTL